MDRTNIPILPKGSVITQEHYAMVTSAVRRFDAPDRGYTDQDGSVYRKQIVYADKIQVLPFDNIPANSVFQLILSGSGPTRNAAGTQFQAGPVPTGGIFPRIFLTNTTNLINNTPGWATIIRPDKPVAVKANPTYTPVIFKACGAESYAASYRGTGLMCISQADSDGFMDVIAYDPLWYYAKLVSTVTAGNFETPTTCLANVWIPDPTSGSAALVQAIDPSLLGITVQNYDPCLTSATDDSSTSSGGSSSSGTKGLNLCRIDYNWGFWSIIWQSGCRQVVGSASCDNSGGLTVNYVTVRR